MLKIPRVEDLAVRVALTLPPDDRETVVGLTEAVRDANEEETVRLTVPWKPPMEVNVTVGVEEPPCGTLTGNGLTATVKSDASAETVMVTVVDLVVKLSLPETITEYWPVAMLVLAEIVKVEVPDTVMLVGLRVAVRPEGDVAVRLAVPANPTLLASVTVAVVEAPLVMVSEEGEPLKLRRNWL